jgi:AmiR/NasT family two-component response regulator
LGGEFPRVAFGARPTLNAATKSGALAYMLAPFRPASLQINTMDG